MGLPVALGINWAKWLEPNGYGQKYIELYTTIYHHLQHATTSCNIQRGCNVANYRVDHPMQHTCGKNPPTPELLCPMDVGALRDNALSSVAL